jgi:hypothetical protein
VACKTQSGGQKTAGTLYCLLIAPWLSLPRASRLLAGVSSLDVDNDKFDHSTRYDSEENELHAEVLDLHTVLGPTVAAQISADIGKSGAEETDVATPGEIWRNMGARHPPRPGGYLDHVWTGPERYGGRQNLEQNTGPGAHLRCL